MNSTPAVAYLLRKTGLSLAEIRQLEPAVFADLYDEVAYQESLVEYAHAYHVAVIQAAIANSVPRKSNRTYKAEDFMPSSAPRRRGEVDLKVKSIEELKALAARFDIALPAREIVEL